MASEAQINANRRNAQKSTGPKTEEGKQKSRYNASRHPITRQVLTMTDHDHAELNKLTHDLVADQKPVGALELALLHSVAFGYWRLGRIAAIEENHFWLYEARHEDRIQSGHEQIDTAALQSEAFFAAPEKFNLLSLYEQRIHRKTEKDLKTFLDLKAKRERECPQDENAGTEPIGKMIAGTAELFRMAAAAREAEAESTNSKQIGFGCSDAPKPNSKAAAGAKTTLGTPPGKAKSPKAA